MARDDPDEFEPYRQDFAQMPGINGNELAPSFRELSPSDTTKRGMLWSSIGVGTLLVAVGIFFLGDWLHWF